MKKQKGITLIALIITVVVLLILAAVTINEIQGDGIIKHAKNAASNYKESQEFEELSLYLLNWQMLTGEEKTTLFNYLETKYPGKVQQNEDGSIIVTMESGNVYKITEDGDIELQPDSVEKLQEKYEFTYYSTLSGAVADVNNNTIGENADVDKEEAVAGIYTDDEGGKVVVLMQDTTESAKITVSKDLTLNLGGNTLNFTSVGIDTVANNGNTIVIDGRLDGSTISCVGTTTANIAAVVIRGGNNLTIDGVTLNTVTENSAAYGINIASSSGTPSTCVISNCNITASTTSETSNVVGISVRDCQATITNCNIDTSSKEETSKVWGIANYSNATITDSIIKAYSNYYSDENAYTAISFGIGTASGSTTTINNCNVMGTQAGVESSGTIYVNRGTYEGVGHGGIYFCGAGTISYAQNAILRECQIPEGYETNGDNSDAGLYIGGAEDNNNITVYMDNCEIYGSKQPIVLRGTSGEQNNTLYISNSKVNLDATWGIRVDSNTHRLYIGRGNNFTKEYIYIFKSMITTEDIEQIVVNTDEVYTRN